MGKFLDGGIYHVYNRGALQSRIFFEEENYCYLFRVIGKYHQQYLATVIAHCLMPNHYHFILRQNPGGSISRFLQTTFNAYSQAVNKRRKTSGTLFQGRPKSRVIDSDAYAMRVIRYIDRNPVEAGIVSKCELWPYSNYLEWIDERSGNLMDKEFRSIYFKDGMEYRRFVEEDTLAKDVNQAV